MKKPFADRLKRFRDRKRWTTGALAEYIAEQVGTELSVRTVENWLQGIKKPHPIWRNKIEEAIK